MIQQELYNIADILQTNLSTEGRKVTGGKERIRTFGALKMTLPCQVISGFGMFSGIVVLMKVKGSLGVFCYHAASSKETTVSIVDLSQLPEQGVGLFDGPKRPNNENAALVMIGAGEKARFHMGKGAVWRRATDGDDAI